MKLTNQSVRIATTYNPRWRRNVFSDRDLYYSWRSGDQSGTIEVTLPKNPRSKQPAHIKVEASGIYSHGGESVAEVKAKIQQTKANLDRLEQALDTMPPMREVQ
jgi:hypothetical protein